MNKIINQKTIIAFAVVIMALGFFGLTVKNSKDSQVVDIAPVKTEKIKAVTSFYPLYFFAQNIAGDRADVVNITPAGAEPHDYEPTARQVAEIEDSNLLILNGGNLESWSKNIQESIVGKKTILVTAGESLVTQEVTEEGKVVTDPHFWLSPPLAKQMIDKILQGFIKADLTNADYYINNSVNLKAEVNKLDAEYNSGLSNCKSKDIITSHASFGYLSATYHLNQVAITGISPDAEPSPKELAEVAKFAKENKVKYIFFESLVSPKLSETIATEVGAKTMVLNPLEGLTSDEISQGKNYLTEMRSNLNNLKIALQCTE
ncbi:MAG: hypothetical protein A3D47_01235 [Candidatus Colwellbacteria bacterium RIFCSPHIGHO2_02_FULL_43_15]|uniref:ABC transporter substrate-binding protein n=1 Tax=Candidatus Colwellbacteria bacterium RIFCSPHIGHO2_02_FULL_43_15 TaxID=1797686 RepID=A0A1G1Z1Y5_9BACT|nr:MAG: hypothetical protein A3D47_01235 [Candidatus Colwellbacteria bacterium RIFCSPHIGHO2_02_FULL_43_15]